MSVKFISRRDAKSALVPIEHMLQDHVRSPWRDRIGPELVAMTRQEAEDGNIEAKKLLALAATYEALWVVVQSALQGSRKQIILVPSAT